VTPPRRLGAALTVIAAALAGSVASAAGQVSVSARPGLYPAFQPGIPRYVSRCNPRSPLRLDVQATGGDQVAVAGGGFHGGHFLVTERRRTGADVSIRVRSSGGSKTYYVRCLPRHFPHWTWQRSGTPQAQWYVVAPVGRGAHGYAAIFDTNGVPVWWRHSSKYGPWDAKLLPNGDLAWTRYYLDDRFGIRPTAGFEEHRLDGRLVRMIRAVGNPTDTHDMEVMPNGHYLVITYRRRRGVDLRAYGGPRHATVYDGEIQELTRSGNLVWTWKAKDHIALSEAARWLKIQMKLRKSQLKRNRSFDIEHLNSVQPDGDGFIVSARQLDAVFRIDRKTGAITWKLGGTKRPESLSVVGDPYGSTPFGGQHDARLYGDGTLTVYDNETYRDRQPRAVRYRIDPQARTATFVEHVTNDEATWSGFAGSARKLPGGDWVICWGGLPLVTEQTATGATVAHLYFNDSKYSYRAFPILPGTLTAGALRRGMDRMARSHHAR
jgi:arylsulfotransferase ASST